MPRGISQSLIQADADAHIPDHERWLHTPKVAADLAEALQWARDHPSSDVQTEELLQRLREDAS